MPPTCSNLPALNLVVCVAHMCCRDSGKIPVQALMQVIDVNLLGLRLRSLRNISAGCFLCLHRHAQQHHSFHITVKHIRIQFDHGILPSCYRQGCERVTEERQDQVNHLSRFGGGLCNHNKCLHRCLKAELI